MGHRHRFFLIFTITLWTSLGSAHSQVFPGAYQQNASFLSRGFLTDATTASALTDDFLYKTATFYKTPLLFPNGGLLGARGVLDHAPSAARSFLDHVRAYEIAHGVTFTLMPFLNGYSLQNTAHAANLRLDLTDPAVRANIVAECERYVSARVPGSYVEGATRGFDGIVIDIEPAGEPTLFVALKRLMEEMRASFASLGLSNKTIGVAAPQHTEKTPKPTWAWNSADYYYMARHVNYVLAMTYDSGVTNGSTYQAWIADQTTQILQAVSGAAWRFDSPHPQPLNGVKVLIGLPGFYTVTKAHDPDVENVAYGAPGLLAGLSLLRSTDRISLGYFQGATMYLHAGGAADSLYARYHTDWWWWGKHWLGYSAPW